MRTTILFRLDSALCSPGNMKFVSLLVIARLEKFRKVIDTNGVKLKLLKTRTNKNRVMETGP